MEEEKEEGLPVEEPKEEAKEETEEEPEPTQADKDREEMTALWAKGYLWIRG